MNAKFQPFIPKYSTIKACFVCYVCYAFLIIVMWHEDCTELGNTSYEHIHKVCQAIRYSIRTHFTFTCCCETTTRGSCTFEGNIMKLIG